MIGTGPPSQLRKRRVSGLPAMMSLGEEGLGPIDEVFCEAGSKKL